MLRVLMTGLLIALAEVYARGREPVTERSLSFFRWGVVAAYTVMVAGVSLNGTSVGEVIFNAVIGTVAIAAIVFAGWINAAERRDR